MGLFGAKVNYKTICLFFAVLFVCPIAAIADAKEAARYYEDAQMRFGVDDTAGAKIQLKNALQVDPDLLAARVLLVRIHVKEGDGPAAEKEVELANKLGADRSLTVVLLAESYVLQHKYKEIIEYIHPAEFSGDIRIKLLNFRGHAFVELNKLDKAQRTFSELASLAPGTAEPYAGHGLVLLRRGELKKAMKQAQRALALAPKDPDAWNITASVNHAMGNMEAAIKGYNRVMEYDPEHIDARIARAGIWIDLGRNQLVADDMAAMREEISLEPRASYLHSIVLDRLGAKEDARQALAEAADIVDRIPTDFLNRRDELVMLAGVTYYSLGQFEKAQPFLARYIKRHPKWVGARKLLGSLLLKNDEYDNALNILKPALEWAPRDRKLLSLLGTAYMRKGQHEKASKLLERAVELSAGAPELRTDLALSRIGLGERLPALDTLADVFEKDVAQTRAGLVLGMLYIERKEYEKAIEVASSLQQQQPDNLTILNLLGSAKVLAGDREGARAAFTQASEIDANFLTAQIGLGRLDIIDGKSAQATRRFKVLLDKHQNDPRIIIELARVEDVKKNYNGAIRWLQKARDQHRNELPARLYLADIYLRSGQAKEAVAVIQEAELISPDNLTVLEVSARSHIVVGKIDIAKAILKNMNRLAGYDEHWLYRIAKLQLLAKAHDDAIYSLRKSVEGQPDFLPSQVMLADVLLATQHLEEARQRAEILRKRFPKRAVVYRFLGDVESRRGQYKVALRHYKDALKIQPSSLLAMRIYSTYYQTDGVKRALNFLGNWATSHPKDLEIKEALAEGYIHNGQDSAALKLYEQLVEDYPQRHNLLNNLAYIYYKTADSRALGVARRAYQMAPEDPNINDTLGVILVDQGQHEEGLRYLRDAHIRMSSDPAIRYHIAVALHKLGRHQETIVELEKALAGDPSFDGVGQARLLHKKLIKK